MPDPLAKAGDRPPNLFDLLPAPPALTTQQEGQIAAAKSAPERYRQILQLLAERGPLAGWQIAETLGCQLHQISGRLSELRDQRVIENAGERRKNPRSGVGGEVVRLVRLSATELNARETNGAPEAG